MNKYAGDPFLHAPYYNNGANPNGHDRMSVDVVIPTISGADFSEDHPGSWLGVLTVLLCGALFIIL